MLKKQFWSCGIFVLMTSLFCSQVQAHFAWILLPSENSREFFVVLSEGPHHDDPQYLARLMKSPATIHGENGKRVDVDLVLKDDQLSGRIPADFDAIAIELPVTWGLMTRDESSFLLRYRAIGILDPARLDQVKFDQAASDGPLLSIQPDNGQYVVVAYSGKSLLANETITVVGPEQTLTLKTSAEGRAPWTPEAAGDFGMFTKATLSESGEIDGVAYNETRVYGTISFRIPETAVETSGSQESTAMSEKTRHEKTENATPDNLPELPIGITSFGAARVGNAIYVYGGHTGDAHEYWNTSQSNQLFRWNLTDPQAAWELVCEGKHRLQGLAMVPHGNRLILVGGFSATNELGEPHHLISHPFVSMFDTETEQWSELPALPQGRSSHDAVVIDNNLYVVGGWCMDGPDSTEWHDSALVMDLTATSPEWNSIPAPGFQRRALALAAYQNKLVAIGGMTPQAGPTREVSFYDPEQQQWQAGPELQGSQGMVGFGASAYELNGQLVATTFDGSIQVLAADNSRWQTTGQTEDARFFHRLLPLDSNRLVNIGGANMESGKFLTPEPVPVKTATPGDPK